MPSMISAVGISCLLTRRQWLLAGNMLIFRPIDTLNLTEHEEEPDFYDINADELPAVESRITAGIINAQPDDKRWQLNYQEAAIFLEEGQDNSRFDTHPRDQDALPAYLIVHNTYFYLIDLGASILLMCLALIENPAVPAIGVDELIHASLELFGLTLIAIGVGMKIRWLGWESFLSHKRTAVKAVVLLIMYVDAIIVIVQQQTHFRVTRALRPFFFIDCHYSGGVRRALRQIFQSLPPIAEMLVLLFYFMLIFATLGFYLFSKIETDTYFQNFVDSLVNLFVLQTTANYPDVMMPAYNHSSWSALFFIVFLILELYFLTNVLLAVVYNTFTEVEKEKFKKLFLHKQLGASLAFKRLCSRKHPGLISFTHFRGLMKYYKPKHSNRDVLLTFRTLNTSGTGLLNLPEFSNIYEVALLKWRAKRDDKLWFERLCRPLDVPFHLINRMVTSKVFEIIVYVVIGINGVVLIGLTCFLSARNPSSEEAMEFLEEVHWYDYVFITFYGVECLLKIAGLGLRGYFGNAWNMFDFVVTVSAIAGIVVQVVDTSFYFVVILRPLRLLRLFEVHKRYRDVAATVNVLLPRMFSMGLVIVVMYYIYAIIGMELFSEVPLENCCQNTTFKSFYSNDTTHPMYYYLNNFEDILNAYVTLFELTVGNNWHIIMYAYAETTSEWSILYFIIFYLSSMVVVTVTVAFVLEAFLFRIQFSESAAARLNEADTAIEVGITLKLGDIESSFCDVKSYLQLTVLQNDLRLSETMSLRFKGARPRTKADLSRTMYAKEAEEWIRDSHSRRRQELQRFLVREMSRQSLNSMSTTPPAASVTDSSLLTRVPFQGITEQWLNHIPESDEDCPTNADHEDENTESMEGGGFGEEVTRLEVEAQIEGVHDDDERISICEDGSDGGDVNIDDVNIDDNGGNDDMHDDSRGVASGVEGIVNDESNA